MTMHRWLTSTAIFTAALLVAPQASRGEIIISEIMYNADGSDNGLEWVEIYNTGSASVDLEGWRLTDEDAGSQPGSPIGSGVSLGAGEALALIEDQTAFEELWGTGLNAIVYPGMGTDLNLGNTGTAIGDEVLQLFDALDNLVDSVDYSAEAPFPVVTGDDETSIYALPGGLTAALNDIGSSWGRSAAGVHGAYAALNGRPEAASPGFVAVPEPTGAALLVAALAAGVRSRRRD